MNKLVRPKKISLIPVIVGLKSREGGILFYLFIYFNRPIHDTVILKCYNIR